MVVNHLGGASNGSENDTDERVDDKANKANNLA